jgi:hypothetical protein
VAAAAVAVEVADGAVAAAAVAVEVADGAEPPELTTEDTGLAGAEPAEAAAPADPDWPAAVELPAGAVEAAPEPAAVE